MAFVLAGAAVLQAQPIITNVLETGGDNEASDTITAKWTGVTWNATVAGEPIAGIAVGAPFTVPAFGEDVAVYVDRNHQYNGATAALPIPTYLLGGEYIMPGNDNRDNASYQLDISVSDAAMAYILVDNRLIDGDGANPPNYPEGVDPAGWASAMTWLSVEGFQPVLTGYNRTGDPTVPDEIAIDEAGDGTGPGNGINQYYSVYSKVILAPGTFLLYQADNSGRNMYGVVVKRLPNSVNNPPEINGLTPTNNTLFHPNASGLSFNATTVSPNNIAPGNIRLFLNESDVSTNLVVGGNGTSRTVSLPALQPDTSYSARIVVSDQAGRSTTNAFNFDTFNAATAMAVEAEDYNYDSGQFNSPAAPNSYMSLVGTREIDFHNNNNTGAATVYRAGDFVGQGAATDAARQSFTEIGATDYQLTGIVAGDWWNYTRSFVDGSYQLYLRGTAGAGQSIRLDRVGGDATTTNQTTSALGVFTFRPGAGYSYVPLTDAAGRPLTVQLSGNTTLRLTSLGANADLQLNYLLVVPTSAPVMPAYIAVASPAPGAANVAPDADIDLLLVNGTQPIEIASISLLLNGIDVTPAASKTPSVNGVAIRYDPPGLLPLASTQNVQIAFSDISGFTFTNQWSFTVQPVIIVIPTNYATALGSGQGSGFNFKIRKAPNYDAFGAEFTLANTRARANQQLVDQIIDPNTLEPYINEAGGPGNNGIGTTPVVNFDQAGAAVGYLGGDIVFPYIDTASTPDPNNIAMEFTTYVELTEGIHRFGVRSDDGFMVAVGPTVQPADATLVLGEYEGGRGNGLPGGETTFDFLVQASGIYGLRMIYYEGNGGANVELYSIDRNTNARRLLNDGAAGAVKTYTSRATQIFTPSVSIVSPTNGTRIAEAPANVTVAADASVSGGQIAKVEFYDGASNKLAEVTSAPFTLTRNNLTAGPYTVWAVATDNKGLTAVSSKVTFKVALLVQVNFQNTTVMEPPEGYLPDFGYAYTDDYYFADYGYHYGWDLDNTANARNRDNVLSPDERYDTFNHLQKPQPAGSLWEIELPSGRYNVFAVAGESDNTDSVFDLTAEGVTFVTGTPTSANRWVEGIAPVTVSDGRLTIGNGPTAMNNKVAFVEIYTLPAEVVAPVITAPVLSGGNITLNWQNGGTLYAAPTPNGPWTTTGDSDGSFTEAAGAAARFYRVQR